MVYHPLSWLLHGIGLDHIEVPFIAGGTLGDFPIEENMVLNIDLELHEGGGMFFEETMPLQRMVLSVCMI